MKKLFVMLLAVAMVLGMLPVLASAETTAATPEIVKVNMALNSILDVNFKVDAKGSDMTGYSVRVTVGSDTDSQSITSYTVEDGLYVYTAKLVAHRLPETVKVELLNAEGIAVQTKESWTAASYLAEVKAADADNADLAAVADSLQNYGAYAAFYADPTGTAPAAADVEAVQASDLDGYKLTLVTNNAALKAVTALYLDDSCDLLVKFNADAFAGCTLLIDGNKTATEIIGTQAVCRISNILPQSWNRLYNIKVLSQNGDSIFECNYGVLSYALQALSKASEVKTGLNGLLKAMYLYNTAAIAYEYSEIPDWDFSTGKDSQGNYNAKLFTMNQLTTYVGDPDVIYVSKAEDPTYGGYYYMYGSNSSTYLVNGINGHLDQAWADQGVVSYNAPCFRSKDLVSWEAAGALGNWFTLLGYGDDWVDWSISSVYAPEVIRGTDGKYYMYYTAAGRTDGDWATKLGWSSAAQSDEVMRHMLGIAVSDTPVGPFTPILNNGKKLPLVDFKAQAGLSSEFSILDPNPFVDDDGTLYLYFKEELRAGEDMCIFGMKMTSYTTPDYSTLKALESNTKYNLNGSSGLGALTASTSGSSWNIYSRPAYYEEVIEAPQMMKHDGKYYLTYSRWGASDEEYSIWQSVGDSPLGNFATETENPLLSGYHAAADSSYIIGTAHHTFITAGAETFMLYHVQSGTLDTGMGRYGYIDRVNFVDGKIVANGPSEGMGWQAEAISGYANIAGDAAISGVTDTNGYLTDSVIPYYSYNSSQVVNVSNGNTVTLTYAEPVYVRAVMVYSALKKANAFTSVNIKITDADGTVNETGALNLADAIASLDSYYQSNGHIPNAPVVAEFSDRYISKIEITVNGSGTMNIPEIVVLGRDAGTDRPAAAQLNKNYSDILYGSNGQGMVIDGSLSEAAWGEIYGTTTEFANGAVTFKTYTDDAGVYFAADVTDSKLYYSGEPIAPWLSDSSVNRNSWFDFYFYATQPGADIDYNNCAEIARFGTDLAGNVHSNGLRVKKAISRSGDKAILEAFISWEQLGVPSGSRIRVLPQYWNADGTSLTLNTPSVAGSNYQDKHAYIEYTDAENVSNLVDFVVNEDGSVSFKAEPINTGSSKQWLNATAGKAILAEATFVNDGSSQYQGGFVLKDADGNEVIFKMATWNGGAFYVNNTNGYGGYFDINYGIDQILGGSGMLANKEPIQARMLYFNGNIQFFVYHNGAWQEWTKLQSLASYMNGKGSDTGVAFAFNTSGNVQVGAGFYGDANSSGKIENLSMEIDSERLTHLAAHSIQHLDGVSFDADDKLNLTFAGGTQDSLKYFLSDQAGEALTMEATFQYTDWFYDGGFALSDGTNTLYLGFIAGDGNIAVGVNTTRYAAWLESCDPKVNTIWTDANPGTADPVIQARLTYNAGIAQLFICNNGTWEAWSEPFMVDGSGIGLTASHTGLDISKPMYAGIAFAGRDSGDAGRAGQGKVLSYSVEFTDAVTEAEYTITYELDGGSNPADAPTSYKFSNSASIQLPVPTKTNYIFDGWYMADTRVTSLTGMRQNVTLTAKWTDKWYFTQNLDTVTDNADGSVSVYAANTAPGSIKYLLTAESGYSITAEATFRYSDWFYHGGFALNDGTNTMYFAFRAGQDTSGSIPIGFNNNVWSNYLDDITPKVNTIWTDSNPSTPDPVIKARLVYENGWAQLYLWNDSTSTWDVWSQPFHVGTREGTRYAGTVENVLDTTKPMRVGVAFDGADGGINGGGYVDNFSCEFQELEYIHQNLDTVTENADGSVSVYAANTTPGSIKYLLTTESGYSITAEATFRYSDWFYHGGFALNDGTNTMYFAFRAGQDTSGSIPIGFNNNVWSNYLDDIDPKVNTIWTDSNPSTPDPVIKARLVYENGWAQLYLWNDSTSTWDVWSQPFHVGTREGTRYAGTVENVLDTTKPMRVGVAFDGADGGINGGGYVDNFSCEFQELEYIHQNLDTVTENADGSVSVYAANTAPGTLKYLLTTQSGTSIVAEATFRYSDWFYHGGFALNDGTNTMYFAFRAGQDISGSIPIGFNNNVWSNYLDDIDPKVNTIWTDSNPSTPDPVIKARLVYENSWAQLYLWNEELQTWSQWSCKVNVGTREGTRYAGTVENVLDTTKPMHVGVAFDGADGGINGGGYVDNFSYTIE